MVWQRTVNPSLFGANRFDPYLASHFWAVSILGIMLRLHRREGSSIPSEGTILKHTRLCLTVPVVKVKVVNITSSVFQYGFYVPFI